MFTKLKVTKVFKPFSKINHLKNGVFMQEFQRNVLIYVSFYEFCASFVNYVIFRELRDRMRFEVDCAKSHHSVISEGLRRRYVQHFSLLRSFAFVTNSIYNNLVWTWKQLVGQCNAQGFQSGSICLMWGLHWTHKEIKIIGHWRHVDQATGQRRNMFSWYSQT